MEQGNPYALLSPSHVAIVERFLWTIRRRRVDPAPTGFQNVNNAADYAPIIDTRLASCIARQMRRDFGKLLIRQPKQVPIHLSFLSEAVNHKPLITPTVLWVRALELCKTDETDTRAK